MAPPLQSKILRSAPTPQDYRLYRAALEYDLVDPIVIESRADVKSAARWRERVEPFHHQVGNLITFCRRLPVTLLADDVGLGKTISAGLIMSELIARGRLSKALIVCPKLLGPQWREELATKFDIAAEVVTGRELLDDVPDGTGAIITTYQSARLHLDELPPETFEMLVLDEAHKLRNLYGSPQPPQVATTFRKALAERRFRYVLMLTATPIQNRLWDLYSLVDLLTVARGHDNPFGGETQFAFTYIEGDRDKAKALKPRSIEKFRSIVYGYMSRVRRGDAKLHFPSREVQLHRVVPTPDELKLIDLVGKGIRPLNRLAQIGILQALVSSPNAVRAQLEGMAKKGSVRKDFALAVTEHVRGMGPGAKLNGLGALIARLRRENPENWRLVIFTGRRETQAAIEVFLSGQGLKAGLINGASGPRNQATLASFRASPPSFHVIISTEAGSEGVNLQAANVLVNYDLPWNPMIVEQRIGRIQRLGSKHARVGIFNMVLKGTFEETVTGRLMEKLQMSTNAIGDIESLLEGAVGGEDAEEGFEEKVRKLVLASLQGADVDASVRQATESIDAAKRTLVEEEKRIDEFLGDGTGGGYVGPKAPHLPTATRSMPVEDFVRASLESSGAKVTEQADGTRIVEDETGRETIRFSPEETEPPATLYAPGSPPFAKLVQRMIASGLHAVADKDQDMRGGAERAARTWVEGFGGTSSEVEVREARRDFVGTLLVRARATVAHDSFERLVEVGFPNIVAAPAAFSRDWLAPLPSLLEEPTSALGLGAADVAAAAARDPALDEFNRFYLERRAQEVAAAGTDERKRKKMEDDFTPRLAFSLVGAEGKVHREVRLAVRFRLDEGGPYQVELGVRPSTAEVTASPAVARCELTQRSVPAVCLGTCVISGRRALRHLLGVSEASGRTALPAFMVPCEATGQKLVQDEVARSAMSGRMVSRALLRTSGVSGRSAEAEHFARCAFSGDEALPSELRASDISEKLYRIDQAETSAVSGRAGHRDEFVTCAATGVRLARDEAERCAVTRQFVRPGILQACEETGTRVLPSQLEPCAITGRRVLKSLLVESSVSGKRMLESAAVRSAFGQFCASVERRLCVWSSRRVHPADLRICGLTGLEVHFEFIAPGDPPALEPLVRLLEGTSRGADRPDVWETAARREADLLRATCRIEAAVLAPSRAHLALVSEVRTLLGLRSRQSGFVLSLADQTIIGRIAIGKRGTGKRGMGQRGSGSWRAA